MRAASFTPSDSGMNTFSISFTFFGKLSSARIVVLLLLKAANLDFLPGIIQERKSKEGRYVRSDTRVFRRSAQEPPAIGRGKCSRAFLDLDTGERHGNPGKDTWDGR
jgi:hypothetical protein